MRYDSDFLISFAKENNFVLDKDYTNERISSVSFIEGICNTCGNKFTKKFYLIYINGCYCTSCVRKKSQKQKIETCKKTCIMKYGVENISQVKKFQDKKINTFIEKYGEPVLYKDGIGQFDSNGSLLNEFICKYDCIKKLKMSDKTLSKALDKNIAYNNTYFKTLGTKLQHI